MAIVNGEVIFCEGCPRRSDFCGPMTQDTEVKTSVALERSKYQYDIGAQISFVDPDGIPSDTFSGRIDLQDYEAAGFKVEFNAVGLIKFRRRIEDVIERRIRTVASKAIIDRIGRCAFVKTGASDHCPAASYSSTSNIFKRSLKNN